VKLPALRDADLETRLATYLNDHLGGATGGVELARRLAASNQGTEYGPPLQDVARQIEEDVATLRDIVARFGVEEDRIKQTVAYAAEKVGRLKLNGQLLGYSPLSRLVELEGMMLGVTGKNAMWTVLNENYGQDPRLAGIDLAQLIARAKEQRVTLERLRRRAATEAIAAA
jgi:hypothetical protein